MKTLFAAQARRIDALSLRERVIMFVSVAAALAAVTDFLVLSPALSERRALAAQLSQGAKQIEALQRQWVAAASPGTEATPQGRQHAAIEHARSELVRIDQEIRGQLSGREEMARLPVVLDRLLRAHPRLTLTQLATATPNASAAARSAELAPSAVRWQGVDLSVAGSYPDLVRYLAELEQTLPGLRWGPLQVSAPASPTTLPVLSVRLMLAGEAS